MQPTPRQITLGAAAVLVVCTLLSLLARVGFGLRFVLCSLTAGAVGMYASLRARDLPDEDELSNCARGGRASVADPSVADPSVADLLDTRAFAKLRDPVTTATAARQRVQRASMNDQLFDSSMGRGVVDFRGYAESLNKVMTSIAKEMQGSTKHRADTSMRPVQNCDLKEASAVLEGEE